ncbi:MAG: c-type cytochrome [Acidobacteriaceae bacterium]
MPPNQEPSPGAAGEELVKANDCSSCHARDRPMVGPSYNDIAKRYQGKADSVDKLAMKVKQGGSGNWGAVPMIPHPGLADSQLKEMVEWILSQRSGAAAQSEAPAKTYAYTLADGTTARLDFPLFVEGQQPKVTKSVFQGYEKFDSYCYRCHGQDATGSETAPDLRNSLKTGMTEQQFISVAMAGRAEKGMPSWAGFLSEDEVKEIYEYVRGRSLDLVPVGRPPSEMD